MVRTICGSVYHPLKPWHQVVEKAVFDYVLCVDGAKVVHSRKFSEDLEYTFFEFPNGGCLLEKFSPPDHLTLTLHFSGSSKLYEGENSLAERILNYWITDNVTIKRIR
jgi:hypothetical protein